MSVTGFMYNINATKKLGELELDAGLEGSRSWHHQYKDSAYVHIGGLHLGLTEGDVVIIFSQFGEIVDVNVIRDRSTGKSKGFAFICYEDQRSTVLAVDNMNGSQLLKRTLRVEHVNKYKAPKELDEDDLDEEGNPRLKEYKATGAEGGGQGVFNVLDGQKKLADVHRGRKALEANRLAPEDADEAWANAFQASIKEIDDAGSAGKEKRGKKDKKDKKQKGKCGTAKEGKEELRKLTEELQRVKKETKKVKAQTKQLKKKPIADRAEGGCKPGAKRPAKEFGDETSQSSASSSADGSDASDSTSRRRPRDEKIKRRRTR